MNEIAICAEKLGKQYPIGMRQPYRNLRDVITGIVRVPWHPRQLTLPNVLPPNTQAPSDRWIWALRDVSFDVMQGEIVGVIGRNGAGKSTLLKILSRITQPTNGYVELHGRVGSLLEVGTGFHPELTGRENVYLSGAILGMRKSEIESKFDQIVDFAEIEKFIDTPVKHYSSGMYMRLAFSVAAHLETEILLVDEVLAVGDAAFQAKCLGKMSDVAHRGRTVLFVSHNMGAIAQLCPTSLLLDAGQIVMKDKSENVIQYYLAGGKRVLDVAFDPVANPNSPAIFTRCWISDAEGLPIARVDVKNGFGINLNVLVRRELLGLDIAFRIENKLGTPIFSSTWSSNTTESTLVLGASKFLIRVPELFLAPDTYSLTIALHRPGVEAFDIHERVLLFEVEESGSDLWQYHGQQYGNILVHFPWQHSALS